ncbi:unnamed protein product, partial [Linum tenue]
YRIRLIVHDGNDQATFLLIGASADKFLPRTASEVNEIYPDGTGILPPDIEALAGHNLEFEIQLPKENNNGVVGDFIVTSIKGLPHQTGKMGKQSLLKSEFSNRPLQIESHAKPISNAGFPLLEASEIKKEDDKGNNAVTSSANKERKAAPRVNASKRSGKRTTQTPARKVNGVNNVDSASSDDEQCLSKLLQNTKRSKSNQSADDKDNKETLNTRKTSTCTTKTGTKKAKAASVETDAEHIVVEVGVKKTKSCSALTDSVPKDPPTSTEVKAKRKRQSVKKYAQA